MTTEQIVLLLILNGVVSGGFAQYIANQRDPRGKENGVKWFFLGLFFGLYAILGAMSIQVRNRTDSGSGHNDSSATMEILVAQKNPKRPDETASQYLDRIREIIRTSK
jgi:hypothetical protein